MSSLAVTRSRAHVARRLPIARITASTVARSACAPQRRTFLTIIHQGHEGWRLTLGRDPVHLEPGLHIFLPIYHTISRLDMRESSVQIPQLPGYTADNVPVKCSGSLFYRVTDSYKACFAVSEVHDNIAKIGQSAMRSVLGSFTYDQVISDRNGLNKKLNVVIGNSIADWGVECSRFEVQTFQPANREVERQLELQMEAERNRRKQLLDTQAQVNVAEGHKQRVILESEGLLVAKANEAEATYNVIVREAEARNKQSILEASALSQQVAELAASLTSSPNISPSPVQREMALSALLSLRRLEQLKAIADGHGNSTYFFGDKASLGSKMLEEYGIDFAEKLKTAAQAVSANAETASPISGGDPAVVRAETQSNRTASGVHQVGTNGSEPSHVPSPESIVEVKQDTTQATGTQDQLLQMVEDAGKLVKDGRALTDKALNAGTEALVKMMRNAYKDTPETAHANSKGPTIF